MPRHTTQKQIYPLAQTMNVRPLTMSLQLAKQLREERVKTQVCKKISEFFFFLIMDRGREGGGFISPAHTIPTLLYVDKSVNLRKYFSGAYGLQQLACSLSLPRSASTDRASCVPLQHYIH